ncbi:N-6 DNA Methylase [Lachnoanaerobaculum sp. MSX33]|uniref:N-6 DNA methylase n=1 Tax=Lachnoanaerobaculum sp. MSX33 TaxID=936596 RepID=UPI0003DFAF6D|nr:N-6 DNA methylase [Lachnoanaerobaculum sp. MSX33]ETO98479.1 N-6 DNA Methylase [Lachnoanaerobaculum sp. MSX33]
MSTQKVIVIPDGKICDYIDGKFRNDTPEEYVRQTIEKRLVNEHKYLPGQIAIEFTLQVGSNKPRADIVIWEKDAEEQTQGTIKLIIECKKETVDARNAKDGLAQLQSYMSVCPNCEWGMWTNSIQKYVFRKYVDANGNIQFMEYNDIPSADGNLDDVNRPSRTSLRNASDDNLLFVFKTCHNHIYVNDGMQKQPAFFELLKVIFCKIEDERNIPNPLEFYTTSEERSNPDGQLTVRKRISKIFERVKKRHGKIFDANDEIKLSPRSLAYIVSELQRYSLLNTNIDIKGKAYEEIVGANLRGDRGEFFTPRNVMKMVVEMINPRMDEKVLDSSCGTGGFLVTAMTHVISQLENEFSAALGVKRADWDSDTIRTFQDRISEMAASNYYGFDINPDLVKATKMNMVMNNDGSGNILQTNSLLPPHEWADEFKARLADALHVKKSEIRNHTSIAYFDVIVTNPPFGSKIPIKDKNILEQFQLAHIWENDKKTGVWKMTPRLQSSVPPEILFIERCTQLLVPGGRMGIVLPDSILGAPGLEYIREWMIKNHRIIASIDLHADTFQPRNGTQTSVLILQKKTEQQILSEETSGQMADYNIFMAMVEKVGHDKRGNPMFKRDNEGNEVLVPDTNSVLVLSETGEGERTVSHQQKRKVEDDQTPDVPAIFADWKIQEGLAW